MYRSTNVLFPANPGPALGRLLILAVALMWCGNVLATAGDVAVCRSDLSIVTAGQPHTFLDDGSSSELIAVEVTEPGWLALQAEVVDGDPRVAWLEVLAPCDSRSRPSRVGGFFDQGVVEVTEPGQLTLRVGSAVHQHHDPADVRLTTHLFAWRQAAEKDGEEGSDTEEEEDEILPILGPTNDWWRGCGDRREPLNDLRICAAPLAWNASVVGSLDAVADGRDHDYFSFRLDQIQRIELVADGPRGLAGTLFDDHGRVLGSQRVDDDPLTIGAVLIPGRYFVRMDGWVGGEYQLHLAARSRAER